MLWMCALEIASSYILAKSVRDLAEAQRMATIAGIKVRNTAVGTRDLKRFLRTPSSTERGRIPFSNPLKELSAV